MLLRLAFRGQIEVWERMRSIFEGKEFDAAKGLFARHVPAPISYTDFDQTSPITNKGYDQSGERKLIASNLIKQFTAANADGGEHWSSDHIASLEWLTDHFGSSIDVHALTP